MKYEGSRICSIVEGKEYGRKNEYSISDTISYYA